MSDKKVIELAKVASGHMVKDTRQNGDVFVKFDDTAPEWCSELSLHAHDDMMPDDWRYLFIRRSVDLIASASEDDDLDELGLDMLDPSIYTNQLLDWLSSNLHRLGYCDEHITEADDTVALLSMGQRQELDEVYTLVLDFLRNMAGEEEEGADE